MLFFKPFLVPGMQSTPVHFTHVCELWYIGGGERINIGEYGGQAKGKSVGGVEKREGSMERRGYERCQKEGKTKECEEEDIRRNVVPPWWVLHYRLRLETVLCPPG